MCTGGDGAYRQLQQQVANRGLRATDRLCFSHASPCVRPCNASPRCSMRRGHSVSLRRLRDIDLRLQRRVSHEAKNEGAIPFNSVYGCHPASRSCRCHSMFATRLRQLSNCWRPGTLPRVAWSSRYIACLLSSMVSRLFLPTISAITLLYYGFRYRLRFRFRSAYGMKLEALGRWLLVHGPRRPQRTVLPLSAFVRMRMSSLDREEGAVGRRSVGFEGSSRPHRSCTAGN